MFAAIASAGVKAGDCSIANSGTATGNTVNCGTSADGSGSKAMTRAAHAAGKQIVIAILPVKWKGAIVPVAKPCRLLRRLW